jgi:hypothetical protein
MQIRPSQMMVMWDHSSVADCRGEWAVRLSHAPPRGKPAPLPADETRFAPDIELALESHVPTTINFKRTASISSGLG